ncbi:hypothetical protein FVF58_34730 [Paraburkholderia panacisoli]|uniref:Uncharacterized protein n=1 Tax=Paraburkholderia panacisoli TaxID=2603818 RepID=A0A5B0GM78_9BURK|nr:hypothetical protein [Paraburkholderia panacisoli]KAA1003841.1 hypothetical protein FVF58_34730 [Paraburkholderia panacisoli]
MSQSGASLQMGADWDPTRSARERLDQLIRSYRHVVTEHLEPLVRGYHPSMLTGSRDEYLKMLELTTKMNVVGHACTEVAGFEYDARRQHVGSLFGACCFLADSFIDDFDDATTRDYLDRLGVLLAEGWFDLRNDRERLFYVIVSRLFSGRDIMNATTRQAILRLYEAQKHDVELRLARTYSEARPGRSELNALRQCASNRSGHAILVLSAFLLPELDLNYIALIYTAGALIMFIDDHGDCFSDLAHDRVTFMNQVKYPERTLRRIFVSYVQRVYRGLPPGNGRDLLIAFLTRYYLTRLDKHRQQKLKTASGWAVYE